jgi:phosphate starvation-inducible PhoH-like protein
MHRNNRQTTHYTKTVNPKKARLRELNNALLENGAAIADGPRRKTWSIHDLKSIRPLTQSQRDMFSAYLGDYNICGYGSAGTGKTFIALYLALSDVLSDRTETDKIIIVRSIASVREPGHLPGTLEEKIAPHEAAYKSILHELIGKSSTYEDMKDAGMIQFVSTSFLRGLTWNNAIVVVDECQNMGFEEYNTIMTRVGKNTRVIAVGDTKQDDLIRNSRDVSGFSKAMKVMELMDEFSLINFLPQDIVRSGFCKSWILSCEEVSS